MLEYYRSQNSTSSTATIEHQFKLISGPLDMPTDKDRAFFDYLLAEDCDANSANGDSDQSNLPVEALFDDLKVSGMMFPLNKYTKSRWAEQHGLVQNSLLVADLRDIDIQGDRTVVTLQTWGSFGVKLIEGHHYRLSPRLVDFNLAKILSTLLELDLRIDDNTARASTTPFLQLITNPRSLAFEHGSTSAPSNAVLRTETIVQSFFRQLHDLGSEAAGALILKASQRRAARRILSQRLTVIWGPPGEHPSLNHLYFIDALDRHRKNLHDCSVITSVF